jgi:hypothetical protein
MKHSSILMLAGTSLAFLATAANAQMKYVSDEELLKNLEGTAPPDVLANATVLNMVPDGSMKTVREGTNGWTCMDPGGAPMCADAAGLEWTQAYVSKGEAPQKLGFIYMLKGDTGVSNTDPYGLTETPDNNWVASGPHVMIVGTEAKSMMQAYPRDAKPDPSKPYVMWPDTPYEHIMLPVE